MSFGFKPEESEQPPLEVTPLDYGEDPTQYPLASPEPAFAEPLWADPKATEFLDIFAENPDNRRRSYIALGLVVAIAIIGGIILVREQSKIGEKTGAKTTSSSSANATPTTTQPPFTYLSPGADQAWSYSATDIVYDPKVAVAKYGVSLKGQPITITISQQQLPPPLKPRSSVNFRSFRNRNFFFFINEIVNVRI